MIWQSWQEFFAMGGYAPYVWGSLLVVFGLLAAEVIGLQWRRRAILQRHAQQIERASFKRTGDENQA